MVNKKEIIYKTFGRIASGEVKMYLNKSSKHKFSSEDQSWNKFATDSALNDKFATDSAHSDKFATDSANDKFATHQEYQTQDKFATESLTVSQFMKISRKNQSQVHNTKRKRNISFVKFDKVQSTLNIVNTLNLQQNSGEKKKYQKEAESSQKI